MSQEDSHEWELSKENVQPLRQGRVMSSLQEALSQQDSSSHTAVQLKKQEFEAEIRFYSGDDPLDVWERYIRWTEQTFPGGGKDGNLAAVLERAVQALHGQQRYYQDPRYLNLWLKFGDCCNEPLDLYSYLSSQEIGTTLALLYITWAEALEARGSFRKADLIFQEGLQRKAEPLDKLQAHHKQFQARVSRQTLLALEQSPDGDNMGLLEIAEPQRSSLADLKGRGKKKVRAPISRVGDALKVTNPNRSCQPQASLQLPNAPSFAVFDENSMSGPEIATLTAQSWPAPPVPRAKENELSAGPWNSGRRPRSAVSSGLEVPPPVPSFTPYVDESAQPQMMTPCKIEPSINRVLSTRKPEERQDPLQRVQHQQQDAEAKKEMVMYCKEKVYAGVDEFSFEEIRAEIYRKKARKKDEDEIQAIERKKEEIQRKIEELEKKLKKKEDNKQQQPHEQAAAAEVLVASTPLGMQGFTFSSAEECGEKQPQSQSEFQVYEDIQLHKPSCSEDVGLLPPPAAVPFFSIFDESTALTNQNISCSADRAHQKRARQPLAVRNPVDSLSAKESAAAAGAGACDELNGIERLSEDAIVSGSYKNKSLCANPEDTCDFNRAAHLASTPFHGVLAQRVPAPAFSQSELKDDSPESKSAPLNQETPVGEEAYTEALSVKKLSPIMEASLEDTHSSGASVSGGSLSSVTQTSAIKYLQISEKLELAQSLPAEGVTDSGGGDLTDDDVAQFLWSPEQRKKFLGSVLSSLAASPDFHLEAGALPHMEVENDVELGNETYCIKMEYWNNEEYKMFFAIPTGCIFQWDAKGFAIKVYSQPVPWDFYITLELQKRLNSDFDQSFSENCSCYLYQDGCAIVHKDTNCFTLRDILRDRKFITKEIIFLVVHDLLHVVEKLHKAEIVHGDLRPEVLFLGDRICDAFSNEEVPNALKVVDFSHSLDLRVLPRVSLPYNFPTAQTPHGQQLLAESSFPYQVDLVGIADIVHLLLFGDHIQVYQENSVWKISQNLSKTPDSDFWSKLFERILNADGKSTVPLLRELREEISEMFDSSFKERLLLTLAAVGETFLLVNFQ
ncbi:mitotic checkpoint serine/threonine-protein kinase BUB1 beta [Motacilla alba alba]|nr:mitotic checkpoint serine/threonine-protein kinase BUB1 beta [Motacilla alba alba]XP_037994396.1 mitotic checkpoint serine/threonine-protein kinase BUB1 beta [Motacilla alba alba]XP_037994397.1 mitotic checkpoint serine/threonine-protein kinase BUB1 beta [Motacilla alba alba]